MCTRTQTRRESEWREEETLREESRASLRAAEEEREREEGQFREHSRALEEEQAALDLDIACYLTNARALIAASAAGTFSQKSYIH
jgi:hypothetical protein